MNPYMDAFCERKYNKSLKLNIKGLILINLSSKMLPDRCKGKLSSNLTVSESCKIFKLYWRISTVLFPTIARYCNKRKWQIEKWENKWVSDNQIFVLYHLLPFYWWVFHYIVNDSLGDWFQGFRLVMVVLQKLLE